MDPLIPKISGPHPTPQEIIMIENFGLYLKHERELRGVALEEIAETTKIHIRFLEALENNDFDNMPGEVFVKGFIRSYAKVIGFDAEEMTNVYDESVGRDRREALEKAQAINEKIQSRKKTIVGSLVGVIALAAIFSLGYFAVENIIVENKNQRVESLPAGEPSTKQSTNKITPSSEIESDNSGNPNEGLIKDSLPGPSPIYPATLSEPTIKNSSPSSPTEPIPDANQAEVKKQRAPKVEQETLGKPYESVGNENKTTELLIESAVRVTDQRVSDTDTLPLNLKIQVQGDSWFNLTVDDGNEVDFILSSGSTKNFYGREKIRLTIGNRKGTHLFLNGQSIDLPTGSSDVIRNFGITADLLE